MFCENCGAKIDEDSKFCENCGEPVRAGSAIEFQEGYGDPPKGSNIEKIEEEIRDVNELMELDGNDDCADSPEKTMIFVKSSSSSKEARKIEEEHQEQKGPMDADPSERELESPVESEAQSEPECQIEPDSESQETQRQAPAGENDPGVFIKSGIDPEDEFFVEPRVGAIRKNLPIVDFGEEPEEREESIAPEEETGETGTPESRASAGSEEPTKPAVLEETEPLKDKGAALTEEKDPEKKGAEAVSFGEPNQEQGTSNTGYEPLFCMACGKALPEGAAFCDACGTRTGAVSPAEIRGRRQSKQGLAFGLLADFFKKPESTIERAADEDACLSGIGFFLFKDVILAVLAAAFMKKITVSLGMIAPWLTGGDSFGFAAKVFLCAILMDALWVGILFGAGYLFRTDCPVKILIGACGTASLLPTVLLIIATLLIAFAPFAAMGAIAVTVLVTLIVMTKAAAAAFIPPQDRLLYLMSASTAVYAIILVAAMSLIDITLFA